MNINPKTKLDKMFTATKERKKDQYENATKDKKKAKAEYLLFDIRQFILVYSLKVSNQLSSKNGKAPTIKWIN